MAKQEFQLNDMVWWHGTFWTRHRKHHHKHSTIQEFRGCDFSVGMIVELPPNKDDYWVMVLTLTDADPHENVPLLRAKDGLQKLGRVEDTRWWKHQNEAKQSNGTNP